MRTYDEAWAAARDQRPFSNGTEGFAWQGEWCDRCLRDAPFRNDLPGATGCVLLSIAIQGRTPSEWLEQPWGQIAGRPEGETAPVLGDQYHCVEFKAPGGGGGEPRPRPEPPNMDGLFYRPERRTRMFTQPAVKPARVTVGVSA